jgi:hypothetical protein
MNTSIVPNVRTVFTTDVMGVLIYMLPKASPLAELNRLLSSRITSNAHESRCMFFGEGTFWNKSASNTIIRIIAKPISACMVCKVVIISIMRYN